MPLYPRLSERGRAWWLLAAVAVGAFGIGIAVARGERTAAGLMAVALALLVAAWTWGRRAGDEDDDAGE